MISYETYKLIHFGGILLLFVSLGMALRGGDGGARGRMAMGHGLGLLLALIGGFGMLARLGIHWPWPAWVAVKFGVWFVLGVALVLVRRAPRMTALWWVLVLALGVLAGWAAIFKPGGVA